MCSEVPEIVMYLCSSLRILTSFFFFFSLQTSVKHWNRVPKEAVDSPSLKVFTRHVDVVFRDMVNG